MRVSPLYTEPAGLTIQSCGGGSYGWILVSKSSRSNITCHQNITMCSILICSRVIGYCSHAHTGCLSCRMLCFRRYMWRDKGQWQAQSAFLKVLEIWVAIQLVSFSEQESVNGHLTVRPMNKATMPLQPQRRPFLRHHSVLRTVASEAHNATVVRARPTNVPSAHLGSHRSLDNLMFMQISHRSA